MPTLRHHLERHRTDRVGWLRAAVLGANDGIVSTASLLMGIAGSNAGHANLVLAAVAGLVGGAARARRPPACPPSAAAA